MLNSKFDVKISIEGYVDVDGKRTKMDLQTKMSGDCDSNIFEEIKDVTSFFAKQQETEQPAVAESGLELIQSLTPDQVRNLKKLLKRL